MHTCEVGTLVHRRQMPNHFWGQQWVAAQIMQAHFDHRHAALIRFPVQAVHPAQIERPGIAAQRLDALKAVKILKIRQCQLAQVAVDGFAKTQPGII